MSVAFRLPPFGKFVDALNAAGVDTPTARGFWGGVTPERRNRCHLLDRCERRQRPVLHLASEHKPRRPENGMGSRQYPGGNRSADDLASPARQGSNWRRGALSRRGGADAGKVANCGTGDRQELACGRQAGFGRLAMITRGGRRMDDTERNKSRCAAAVSSVVRRLLWKKPQEFLTIFQWITAWPAGGADECLANMRAAEHHVSDPPLFCRRSMGITAPTPKS